VEKLVAGQLGLKDLGTAIDLTTVTDDLLACSVARVRWVARILLAAIQEREPSAHGVKPAAPIAADRLQAQAAVQI
jgi:hypothetical protein